MTEYNEAMKKLMPLPARIARLPISDKGYVTPWFASTLSDGTRELRGADFAKRTLAVKQKLCWVCGEKLGAHMAFVLGPMCSITRTTSEPPCHYECAHFTCVACPFLTKPKMRRNETDLPLGTLKDPAPGIVVDRNPGCSAIWVTRSYRTFKVDEKGWLIRVGDPERVEWWAEGRAATRAEVEASITSGFPLLEREARRDGRIAEEELRMHRRDAERYLPAAA